jgi:succinate dehydrogenase / fumarate reductase, iron-sulfur subunit
MPEYTLRLRRFSPQTRPEPWWEEVTVELDRHHSVLDGILEAKERDGTIAIRYSCRAAICGSCGVRINGRPGLACHTQLGEASQAASGGAIVIEPMGNMPVLKDLIADMDTVHWRKLKQVRPWLVAAEPQPEREYIVPHETMVDVTQTMACIQCGACVSDCLSMEVDPLFVGPAALAKAYRFVSDPRDADDRGRLRDLAEDPHGLYDCTHCFNCVDACPKGVAPMNQIMRLRRIAGSDLEIDDANNGLRHEHGFVDNVRKNGLLHEGDLLTDSYGGKLKPRTVSVLFDSLPGILQALRRRKFSLHAALGHPHRDAQRGHQRYFDRIEARPQRVELNLYSSGYDDDPGSTPSVPTGEDSAAVASGPNPRKLRDRPGATS